MIPTAIRADLKANTNREKAQTLQYFFKTGKGQYGEGDIFWGIPIPVLRDTLKRYRGTPPEACLVLLNDPVHEVRMMGGMLMVDGFKRAKGDDKQVWYEAYMANATCFNNWDLVDLTCPTIVGGWLLDKDRSKLYEFAHAENLWKQRISIISTMPFIKKGDFHDTFQLADILFNHKHDLIHKAVGWMLREIGKKDHDAQCAYLLSDERYKRMPRTMLRYAIEKFPEDERQFYLKR